MSIHVHVHVFVLLYPLTCNLIAITIISTCPVCCNYFFMPPAWKVRRGHLVIGSSVRLSVCLSVCLSIRNSVPLSNKVQYLKFGWWYSNQTWTVSSSIGSSHFTDIPCPWGWGEWGQNVGLRDFCHIWTLLPPGASVFHKHMSSLYPDCIVGHQSKYHWRSRYVCVTFEARIELVYPYLVHTAVMYNFYRRRRCVYNVWSSSLTCRFHSV